MGKRSQQKNLDSTYEERAKHPQNFKHPLDALKENKLLNKLRRQHKNDIQVF